MVITRPTDQLEWFLMKVSSSDTLYTRTGHSLASLNILKDLSVTERVGQQLSYESMITQERRRGSIDAALVFFPHRTTGQEKMEWKAFSYPS